MVGEAQSTMNVRPLRTNHIPQEQKDVVADSVQETLNSLVAMKSLIAGSVTGCCTVAGYTIQRRGHNLRVSYISEEGVPYPVRKRFQSLRRARVFAKRTSKGMLLMDMSIQPVKPLEYINVTIKV